MPRTPDNLSPELKAFREQINQAYREGDPTHFPLPCPQCGGTRTVSVNTLRHICKSKLQAYIDKCCVSCENERKQTLEHREYLSKMFKGHKQEEIQQWGKHVPKRAKETLQINGCTLVRTFTPSRCSLGDSCPHYSNGLEIFSCLSQTSLKGWRGWTTLPNP